MLHGPVRPDKFRTPAGQIADSIRTRCGLACTRGRSRDPYRTVPYRTGKKRKRGRSYVDRTIARALDRGAAPLDTALKRQKNTGKRC